MALLLIDGLNLIRRVHAGVPPDASDHHEAVINACVASKTEFMVAPYFSTP